MENATKALLIAGGILLAVLILSLLILLFSNISSNQLAQEKKIKAEQLKEFNQQWEAYNKKALFGADIITVVNKANDKNKESNVTVKIKCGGNLEFNNNTWSGDSYKTTVFSCTGIDYVDGRVHQINFEIKS